MQPVEEGVEKEEDDEQWQRGSSYWKNTWTGHLLALSRHLVSWSTLCEGVELETCHKSFRFSQSHYGQNLLPMEGKFQSGHIMSGEICIGNPCDCAITTCVCQLLLHYTELEPSWLRQPPFSDFKS